MRAIVCDRYGSPDVLELREVETPAPGDEQVLVRVHAASVNAADLEILRGDWPARFAGPFKPAYRILGSDVAGRVEAVGKSVTRLRPGDHVFGELSPTTCNYGAFAEYVCAPETALALKPEGMSFEQAAALPSAAVLALQALRDKRPLEAGQKVLINGAGGSVGTFAVQIAKALGAEVTGVDSTGKLEMLRSIGADHVIDFTREDFTRCGRRHDLVVDIVASRSVFAYRRALRPGGIGILVGGSVSSILQAVLLGSVGSKKVGLLTTWEPNRKEDVAFLIELFEAGRVKPVIDRLFTLSQVPDALRSLEKGEILGKAVIRAALN